MEIAVAIAVDFHGNCLVSEDYRGWSAETAVAIAADFRGNCRVSEDCRGNGRGWPWMAVEIAVD